MLSLSKRTRRSFMYTLIEYPVGVVVEAVVLSMEQKRLRVAAPGFPDALEFTKSGLEWVTEEGRKVNLAFLQYDVEEAAAVFAPGLAFAAGGSGIRPTDA
jgi:hypothetical protein